MNHVFERSLSRSRVLWIWKLEAPVEHRVVVFERQLGVRAQRPHERLDYCGAGLSCSLISFDREERLKRGAQSGLEASATRAVASGGSSCGELTSALRRVECWLRAHCDAAEEAEDASERTARSSGTAPHERVDAVQQTAHQTQAVRSAAEGQLLEFYSTIFPYSYKS